MTNRQRKQIMDEKYILELGRITNSIENLIKNQDKHYSELRDMLQKQRDHTELELRELKVKLEKEREARIFTENKMKERFEKVEKFDVKIVAYITVISFFISLFLRFLPNLIA